MPRKRQTPTEISLEQASVRSQDKSLIVGASSIETANPPKRQRKIGLTSKTDPARWRPLFLEALAETGIVTVSCDRAVVTLTMAYALRETDPDFRREWEEALLRSVAKLEETARKRALTYSDTLLIFLLKGNMPEKYGDQVKITSEQRVLARVEVLAAELGLTPEDIIKAAKELTDGIS